jgi:membrane protein YqaA with SNARE-associated domain
MRRVKNASAGFAEHVSLGAVDGDLAVGRYQLPPWLQAAVAASGGWGLFILAFLDSTFLPFPSVNDLLLIDLCFASPLRMPYYAAMSTLGSVVGSLLLYFMAKKGGEAAFHAKAGKRGASIHRWVQRNGFISLVIAAVMPPPMPFKFFVLAAGALGMPLGQFVLALTLARGARFYGEGYLAVRYGGQAERFLMQHKTGFAVSTVISVLVLYVVVRLLFRPRLEPEA